MALIRIDDNDPWLLEYDACEKLFRDIMEELTMRNREVRTSQAFAALSANIRFRMKQYNAEVRQLRKKVEEASKFRTITVEEAERRSRQIEQLESKEVQLQRLYESRSTDLAVARADLMRSSTSAFADRGTTSWGIDNDDDQPIDVHVSIDDLKKRQQQMLQEQEDGLAELSKVISRQKNIAQAINSEVDHQNEIIEDLADHMEKTDERLIDGTRHIRRTNWSDSVCIYWVIIILLFISIIATALA
ncbi:syntaxin-8 [Orussus abietinus]|uniref:syntaxin-8 n=1 Tax=Orussus abietinus TaxID=222816 RepID=UPI000625A507|nr:syntaxin-8 [Orussus abietinus]